MNHNHSPFKLNLFKLLLRNFRSNISSLSWDVDNVICIDNMSYDMELSSYLTSNRNFFNLHGMNHESELNGSTR